MSRELEGKNIAILVTNGFEQVEMTQPRQAFIDAGASTYVVSPAGERVQGWNHFDKADYFQVDLLVKSGLNLPPINNIPPIKNSSSGIL